MLSITLPAPLTGIAFRRYHLVRHNQKMRDAMRVTLHSQRMTRIDSRDTWDEMTCIDQHDMPAHCVTCD